MSDEKKPTGGLAFPAVLYNPDGVPTGQDLGMTIRDWFAGNLMPGLMAELYQQCRETKTEVENIYVAAAGAAYEAADAMIEERSK